MVGLGGELLHHIVRPLDAGETDGIRLVLELLDDLVREDGFGAVVCPHLVVEQRVVVRIGLLYKVGGSNQ